MQVVYLNKTANKGYIVSGIFLLACALIVLFASDTISSYLSLLLGVAFCMSAGTMFLAYQSSDRNWQALKGVFLLAFLDIFLGLLFILYPEMIELNLQWILGLGFILYGIFETMSQASFGRLIMESGAVVIISGVLSIVVGLLFIVWPTTIGIWIAAFVFTKSVTMIAAGLAIC